MVSVERDDLCQQDVLSFSGAEISKLSLDRLAKLALLWPSRFVFATDDLQDEFEQSVRKSVAVARGSEILKVQPIHGYGWTDGHNHIAQPEPFIVFARTEHRGGFTGLIVSEGHEFDGSLFEASPRHTDPDGVFNCKIVCSADEAIHGYCEAHKAESLA